MPFLKWPEAGTMACLSHDPSTGACKYISEAPRSHLPDWFSLTGQRNDPVNESVLSIP